MINLCLKCHGIAHSVQMKSTPYLTKLGLARAKARGVKLGRPRLFKDNQEIIDNFMKGMSLRQIAKLVKTSPATVWRRLKDEQKPQNR